MAEEKLFTKEAVVAAIQLTAQGMVGLLKRDEAEKMLEALPESLASIVIEETVKAFRERASKKAKAMSQILGILAQGLSDEQE